MPGQRSSLVWVERPEETQRLLALTDDGFLAALEHSLQGLLGSLSDLGTRAAFPLSGLSAEKAGWNRVALVGESAHVFPPIGAQGLNLGLRDGAVLADSVASALAAGQGIGGPEALANYTQARSADIGSRVFGVDILNRSLIADILPTHLARGIGLHLLKSVGPLRRFLVREGLQPSFVMPSLMQEDGAALLQKRARPASSTGRRASA
jgi:2-octaprenyl-6-methoxyphenol hydroxylase